MNIDNLLERAGEHTDHWTPDLACKLARRLADANMAVDWDPGSGEAWIRLVDGRDVVAHISVELPIVFHVKGIPDSVPSVVSWLVVDDFDQPILSVNRKALDRAFRHSIRLELLDVARFSVNDLWYATV